MQKLEKEEEKWKTFAEVLHKIFSISLGSWIFEYLLSDSIEFLGVWLFHWELPLWIVETLPSRSLGS